MAYTSNPLIVYNERVSDCSILRGLNSALWCRATNLTRELGAYVQTVGFCPIQPCSLNIEDSLNTMLIIIMILTRHTIVNGRDRS